MILPFLLFPIMLLGQQRYTLSGTISDAGSNETMIGVSILVPDLQTGAITNEYGFYSLTLPEGNYELIISALGFRDIRQTVNFNSNQRLDFGLESEAEQLEEVVVT